MRAAPRNRGHSSRSLSAQFLMTAMLKKQRPFGPLPSEHQQQAEGAGPGADQQVGGRLGGAVGRARAVGRLLGEAGRVVERQVAVDLVGGDVVVAHTVLSHLPFVVPPRRKRPRAFCVRVGRPFGAVDPQPSVRPNCNDLITP